jgi:LysM repeat protein
MKSRLSLLSALALLAACGPKPEPAAPEAKPSPQSETPAPKPKAEAKPAPKKARPTLVPLEDSVEIAGGDTLWGLSKKHGISLKRLLEMNQDIDPLRMQIGQRVRLRPTPSPLPADNGMTPTDLADRIPAQIQSLRA